MSTQRPCAGANRRWRVPFRCRGSRHESAVAQLSTLGHMRTHLHCLVAVAFAGLVVSCSIPASRPSVDIDIRNDSTNHLNWVSVLWDEGKL